MSNPEIHSDNGNSAESIPDIKPGNWYGIKKVVPREPVIPAGQEIPKRPDIVSGKWYGVPESTEDPK